MRTPLLHRLLATTPGVLLAGALLLVPALQAVPTGQVTDQVRPAATSSQCRGANAFAREGCNPLQRSGSLTPSPSRAAADRPSVYERDCIAKPPSFSVVSCELALSRGRLHVALLGNSIASQWADAMARIGKDHGWRVTTYLSSGCPPSELAVPQATFPDRSAAGKCRSWGRAVRDRMIRQGVDVVVVTSASGAYPDKSRAETGYLDYLRPLTTAGVLVETVRSPPHPTATLRVTPPACLRDNADNYLRCSGSREAWVETDPMYAAGARLRRDRAGLINLTDRVCTTRTCVSAAGGVLLYRDGNHLTRTYVDTLRPYLDLRLTSAIRADR